MGAREHRLKFLPKITIAAGALGLCIKGWADVFWPYQIKA
jgi:hypothetical protein